MRIRLKIVTCILLAMTLLLVRQNVITMDKVNRFELVRSYSIPNGKIHRSQLYYKSLPVINATAAMKMDHSGNSISTAGTALHWRSTPDMEFKITHSAAINIATKELHGLRLRDKIENSKAVTVLSGNPVACWKVEIPAAYPLGDWQIIVDASSGEILRNENKLKFADASALVFNPDPMTTLGDSTIEDDDDSSENIPEEAYTEVDLLNISYEDSLYHLTGRWVDTSPTENRAEMETAEFIFDREDDRFEEVMAYYHIDRQARYLSELGYTDFLPDSQLVHANGVEEDLSFYSPFTETITYGSGGVDDAEDADVIIHEYSHAIIDLINPDWSGADVPILVEGTCDYFAGDYSLEINDEFQPFRLFNWDGNNEFWDGRILNSDLTYDSLEGIDAHDAGQMWSSLLTEIRLASGDRDGWNAVILETIALSVDSMTIPETYGALIRADSIIADHQFRSYIVDAGEKRNIPNISQLRPQIIHTPLKDNESDEDEILVNADILSEQPIDPFKFWLIVSKNGEDTDTIDFSFDGFQMFATIPPPEEPASYEYYISVYDMTGVNNTHPDGAPLNQHRFEIGPDLISPQIVELDTIQSTVFPIGEKFVSARVTDNIGLEEVSIIWYRQDLEPGGIIPFEQDGVNLEKFTGLFDWEAIGSEQILYRLLCVDASAAGNASTSRLLSFSIEEDAVIEDFEKPNDSWRLANFIRTDNNLGQGEYCISNRDPDRENISMHSIAQLLEKWDFSHHDRALLKFWEIHHFIENSDERGWLEYRNETNDEWTELLELRGESDWWNEREIDLSEFCDPDAEPIYIRFRSFRPRNIEWSAGWKIDNIRLEVGNVVEADDIAAEKSGQWEIGKAYPNPANSHFQINYQISEKTVVNLYTSNGRLVGNWQLQPGNSVHDVAITNLPAGVYVIQFQGNSESNLQKIVLIK